MSLNSQWLTRHHSPIISGLKKLNLLSQTSGIVIQIFVLVVMVVADESITWIGFGWVQEALWSPCWRLSRLDNEEDPSLLMEKVRPWLFSYWRRFIGRFSLFWKERGIFEREKLKLGWGERFFWGGKGDGYSLVFCKPGKALLEILDEGFGSEL